jgi:hypothetical protein
VSSSSNISQSESIVATALSFFVVPESLASQVRTAIALKDGWNAARQSDEDTSSHELHHCSDDYSL